MSIYLPLIPTGLINLDVDYQNIQNNFSQLDTSFGLNHIKFSVGPNNGKHTYVEMVDNVAIPGGLSANEVTLYTKTTASVTDIFVTPDNSGKEYQLTLSDAAHYASFGTYVNYAPPVVNQNGGWSFLPGGLLFQYGKMLSQSGNGTVIFPIAFTTLYSLVFSTNSLTFSDLLSHSNSQFQVGVDTAGREIFWQAIGKK